MKPVAPNMLAILSLTLVYYTGAIASILMIRNYLNSRPPGMQTLFTFLVKDLLDISIINITASVTIITLGTTLNPLDSLVAIFIVANNYWLALILFLQVFFVIGSRYIIIYQSR